MNFGTLRLSDWLLMLEGQSAIVFRCVFCSSLVIALTWLVVYSAANKSAAIRHRIFALGFGGMLVVPFAVVMTVGWNPTISFFGSSNHQAVNPVDAPRVSTKDVVIAEPAATDTRTSIQESFGPVSNANPAESTSHSNSEPDAKASPVATTEQDHFVHSANPIAEQRNWHLKPQHVFGSIWAAGILLFGIKLIFEWFVIRGIVRNAMPVTDEQTISQLTQARQLTQQSTNGRSNRHRIAANPVQQFDARHQLPSASSPQESFCRLGLGNGRTSDYESC